jgi:hypothetical protein
MGKLTYLLGSWIFGPPLPRQQLPWGFMTQERPRTIEPATDPDVVIGSSQIADDERQEMETRRHLIRCWTGSRRVTTHTDGGHDHEPGEQVYP